MTVVSAMAAGWHTLLFLSRLRYLLLPAHHGTLVHHYEWHIHSVISGITLARVFWPDWHIVRGDGLDMESEPRTGQSSFTGNIKKTFYKIDGIWWWSGGQYRHVIPTHDDVIKWEHFPRYWPFVRGIHRSPVNSPHKGQWRWALMFSLFCAWINCWVNNHETGDLRRHRSHYDVAVMCQIAQTLLYTFTSYIIELIWACLGLPTIWLCELHMCRHSIATCIFRSISGNTILLMIFLQYKNFQGSC